MSFFFCTLYQFLKCFGAPDCRPGRWWSFGGAPHHRSCEECVVTRSSEHHGKRCIELRTKTLTTITFSTIIRQMLSALKTLLFGKGSKVDPVEKPSPSSSSKKQIEQLPETTSRRMYQGNWSKKDTPLLMSSRRVTPVHSSQNHSSSVRRITPVHSVHSVRRITPVHSPTPSSRPTTTPPSPTWAARCPPWAPTPHRRRLIYKAINIMDNEGSGGSGGSGSGVNGGGGSGGQGHDRKISQQVRVRMMIMVVRVMMLMMMMMMMCWWW